MHMLGCPSETTGAPPGEGGNKEDTTHANFSRGFCPELPEARRLVDDAGSSSYKC